MESQAQCSKCRSPVSNEVAGGFCAACLLAEGLSPVKLNETPIALKYFGDYELIEEVARGGMGVVFKARQRSLDRTVAVKMILSGHLASKAEAQRFWTEARAAAALQHPGIVAIHEVGEHEGLLFFSMDYVAGQNLAQVVHDGPLPAPRAAQCVRDIAEAIHYAHDRGVLHRDLKPSNVLLDANGKPHVTDFGLAKQLNESQHANSDPHLTLSGQVLGSPNFMSPEQAAGKHRGLTPASDVYSLGALLYHLLTGRPPFLADNIPSTLRLVAETEPVSPRLLVPAVPRDLETICLKCLEKDPQRRYATAHDLAAELQRFLHNEPIRARPISMPGKVARWCRRHPAMAVLVTISVGLLLGIAIISTVAAARLEQANADAKENLRESLLAQAHANRWSGRSGRRFDSLEALRRAASIRPGMDLRNEAIAAMALIDISPVKCWPADHPRQEYQVFDATFERYLRTQTNGTILVYRTSDDRELFRWAGEGFAVMQARFSPDGRFIAAGWHDNKKGSWMRILDLEKNVVIPLPLSDLWLRTFCFSPNGRRLAVVAWSLERNTSITIHDTAHWRPLSSLRDQSLPYGIAFDPSGERFVVGGLTSPNVEIRDANTCALRETLIHNSGVYHIAWSSTGRTIACGCADEQIYIWDCTQVPPRPTRWANGSVAPDLQFKEKDELLCTTDWHGWAKIWQVGSGKELLRWPAAALNVHTFSDRPMVSCYSSWTSSELFEIATAPESQALAFKTSGGGSHHLAYSPDGRLLVTAHDDGVRVWDTDSPGPHVWIEHRPVGSLSFARDGSGFLSGSRSEALWWPITSTNRNGTNITTIGQPVQLSREAGENGAGKNRLATVASGKAYLIDSRSHRIERRITSTAGIFATALSPDGNLCATWSLGAGEVELWNAEDGTRLRALHAPNANQLAFSPDGRWLVTSSSDEFIFWETASWMKSAAFLRTRGGARGPIEFSSDSQVVALGIGGSTVQLLDADHLTPLAIFEAPESDPVSGISFSPDVTRMAVCSQGQQIRVWNLPLVRGRLGSMKLDFETALPRERTHPNQPLQIVPVLPVKATPAKKVPVTASNFPPRDSRCSAKQIDLTRFYNAPLTNSWFNPWWVENDLATLPHGLQVFDGVTFDVRGLLQLSCNHPDLAIVYPEQIDGIPLGQTCRAIHFLHAVGWYARDDSAIGDYVVRYADGVEHTIPIVYGGNTWSWWELDGKSINLNHDTTTLAWRGRNPFSSRAGRDLLLFHFRWNNPRPDQPVASLTFRSRQTQCAPFLIAITAD